MAEQQLIEAIQGKASGCDYIRFTTPDMNGIPRGKVVPRRNFASMAEIGVGTYGGLLGMGPMGELTMYKQIIDIKHGSCYLKPEPDTFRLLPWDDSKVVTGQVICEPHWYEDSTYMKAGPRYVLRQQLQKLLERDMQIKSACELEFQIMKQDRVTPVFHGKEGCFVQSVFASMQDVIYDIEERLLKAGVDFETLQTEYAPGQFEVVMKPVYGIKGADDVFIAKSGIKEICQTKNLFAHFMTKPYEESVGNGLHFNYSVWKSDGTSVLYDPNQPNNLSKTAQHWIAGLLHHTPGILALNSSTVNCYRRLRKPWAPTYSNWGIQDRLSTIRVKNKGATGTYIENRMAGGLGNPYLMMASNIAAGLDGIDKEMELPAQSDVSGPKVPANLDEAIKALQADTVICEALGTEFIEWFVKMKDTTEIALTDVTIPVTEEAYAKERNLYMPLM